MKTIQTTKEKPSVIYTGRKTVYVFDAVLFKTAAKRKARSGNFSWEGVGRDAKTLLTYKPGLEEGFGKKFRKVLFTKINFIFLV